MKTLILIFIFIPFVSFSQYIKSNQTDAFTHQKRIVTNEEILKNNLSHYLSVQLRTVNNDIFIILNGDGADIVNANDIALLITGTDTLIIKSTAQQGFSKGEYFHQYSVSKKDLINLSLQKLICIRRYTSRGIFDININPKFQSNLMLLSDALLKEMDK
jgi:hypothetical protein